MRQALPTEKDSQRTTSGNLDGALQMYLPAGTAKAAPSVSFSKAKGKTSHKHNLNQILFNLHHHTYSQHSWMQLHFHKQGTVMGRVGHKQASMLVNTPRSVIFPANFIVAGRGADPIG